MTAGAKKAALKNASRSPTIEDAVHGCNAQHNFCRPS